LCALREPSCRPDQGDRGGAVDDELCKGGKGVGQEHAVERGAARTGQAGNEEARQDEGEHGEPGDGLGRPVARKGRDHHQQQCR